MESAGLWKNAQAFFHSPWITSSLKLASYPHFPQPRRRRPRDRFSFSWGLPPPNPRQAMNTKEGAQAGSGPKNKDNPYTKRQKTLIKAVFSVQVCSLFAAKT